MAAVTVVRRDAEARKEIRLEHTVKGLVVKVERIPIVHFKWHPVILTREVERYRAGIDKIHLYVPRGGYFGNNIIRGLWGRRGGIGDKDQRLVENHFDLGLFGDISFTAFGEAGTPDRAFVLPAVRLAHMHYPVFIPGQQIPIYLDYSMGDEGTEHRDLVAELMETAPDLVVGYVPYGGEKRDPSPVLIGTNGTLEDLFEPLKQEVEDLARRHIF